MWRRGGVLVAVAVVCATACGGAVGVRHRVAPGENLYRIGKAYGVSHEELARRNGIADPARIEVGQTIFIPHARTHLPVEVITPVSAQADRPAPRELSFFVPRPGAEAKSPDWIPEVDAPAASR